MNSKLTFTELVNLLAEKSGFPRRVCDDFLKQLFATITEALETGDNVRIKGFGTFKVTEVSARKSVNVTTGDEYEIPAHRRVTFLPAKELASLANAPFEAFDAIEIADDISDEELEAVGSDDRIDQELEEYSIDELAAEEESAKELASEQERTPLVEPEWVATEELAEAEAAEEEEAAEADEPEQALESEEPEEADKTEETDESEAEDAEETAEEEAPVEVIEKHAEADKKSFRFGWGFFSGFACALLIGVVGYALMSHHGLFTGSATAPVADSLKLSEEAKDVTVLADADTENETVRTDEVAAEAQTIKPVEKSEAKPAETQQVATKASDAPVYDTISTTRYLTTMAKEHYGNYNLWPYIYKENEAILGHPDRIRPGTKVVVPKLSKYGVNPNNPDDVARAKRLGVEIYARYNK